VVLTVGVWKQIRPPGPGGPLADQPGDPDPEIAPKENMFGGSGKVLNTPDAHFAYIISQLFTPSHLMLSARFHGSLHDACNSVPAPANELRPKTTI